MRQKNMDFMSKCYFCNEKSHGIKAIDYRLYAVCPDHEDPKPKNDLPPRPEEEEADIWSTQSSFEE